MWKALLASILESIAPILAKKGIDKLKGGK